MKLTWNAATTTVFTEATGTFEFTDDDIRAVYVDWGDGTDPAGTLTNKKEYANYQWYATTEPTSSVALTHTYTIAASGAAKIAPVVQTVNSKGFFSRYYSSGANTEVKPYTDATTMSATFQPLEILNGESTAVLRTQNKTVKSGIDNSLLSDEHENQGRDIFLQVAPTLSDAELAYIDRLEIDIDCVLNQTMINYSSTSGLETGAQVGGDPINQTLTVVVSGSNLQPTIAQNVNILASGNNGSALVTGATVQRINKVTFKNPKYTGSDATDYTKNEVFNRLKVFITAQSDADSNMYLPITYITPGAPIKKANDPLRNVNLDFSQSRTKASNKSISYYRYDVGKGWFNPADKWVVGTLAYPSVINEAYRFQDQTLTASTSKKVAYTYMCNPRGMTSQNTAVNTAFENTGAWSTDGGEDIREDQFALDDYGRLYDQYHLARVTAQSNDTAAAWNDPTTSSLESGSIEVFRITPGVEWPSGSDNGAVTYPTKVLDYAGSDTQIASTSSQSANYAVASQDNVSGATSITSHPISGLTNLSGMNSMDFKAIDNSTSRNANEYLLALLDNKTNQIFFNMSNYADNIQSDLGTAPAYGIAGVSYLKVEKSGTIFQNVYWEPLEFVDNTAVTKEYRDTANKKYTQIKASLAKSGSISFDTPDNWQAISLNTLCGGNFSQAYTVAGGADIAISGAIETPVAGGSNIGEYIILDPTAASETTMGNALLTADKIGSFKYIFVCTDSDNAALIGSAYWLSKDGANGWNGSDQLYLYLGNTGSVAAPANADNLTGSIRRINIYDALTGFSKVYKDSASTTKLPMVDASGTTAVEATRYPFDFNILTAGNSEGINTVGGRIEDAWGLTDMYPIRISLSGAQTAANVYPEIWNVFDANQGNSVVVREIDDSAYNLNSIPIVSDISLTRAGNYFQAITRKGKVFIARIGTPMQSVGFSSVALGNENNTSAFTDEGPSSLYGHLHKIRKLQGDSVRVYWDEPQKDGTFVRLWGILANVSEIMGTGGPSKIVSYSCSMMIEEVALLDANYKLMTDIFPLGGVLDEKDFT